MVANRVAPSTEVVVSISNEMKKKSYSPKTTMSNKSFVSSPRLIIANHLYLNRGPKLSWDPKSCAYVNTNIKGPIFKWVPKSN
jgi:hypothetical protein